MILIEAELNNPEINNGTGQSSQITYCHGVQHSAREFYFSNYIAIQCQVEFISFNNGNNNECAYKINESDTILLHWKIYPRAFKFYQLRKSLTMGVLRGGIFFTLSLLQNVVKKKSLYIRHSLKSMENGTKR